MDEIEVLHHGAEMELWIMRMNKAVNPHAQTLGQMQINLLVNQGMERTRWPA